MLRKGGAKGRFDRDKKIPKDAVPRDKLIESTKNLLWGKDTSLKFPTTRAGWYKFTLDHFPIPIPKERICKDHDTPLDFIIQFITGRLEHMINIIFCSRGSFKTYTIALGSAIKMIYSPGCQILYMAGIEKQTNQGHDYFRKFWDQFAYTENYLNSKKDIQSENTSTRNGSNILFGAFTEAMANSQRRPVIIVDEIDSVRPFNRRALTEDVISVPDRIHGIQPVIVFTSSVREFGGTMAWLLEKNGKIEEWVNKGICKVWNWCYKETTEKCHKYVGRCEKYFEKKQHLDELKELGELRTFHQFREHERLRNWTYRMEQDCPLVVSCHGDLHRAPDPVKPGSLRDLWDTGGLMDKIKGLSKRAIKAQYDCILPKERGKLYDEELLIKRMIPGLLYDHNPKFENHLLIDWGFTHATAIILVQRDFETNVDYAVKKWKWERRNPNWRVDQIERIWRTHQYPQVHADAENADMNNLLEEKGIEIIKVAFGGPSAVRDKSKLSYGIGILEKRLESELIYFSQDECEDVVDCLRSLLDKSKSGHRFGVEDDHFHSALLTLYTDENPDLLKDAMPKISQREQAKTLKISTPEQKPILIGTQTYTGAFKMTEIELKKIT